MQVILCFVPDSGLHFLFTVLSQKGLCREILCSFVLTISIVANYVRTLAACVALDGVVGSEEANCCLPFFQQERTRSFDGFSMHSLENSLIDIMRAEQDSLKGWFTHYQW